MVQSVENLPAMQEMQVQSLDQEDPLEKEMATHPIILVWEIPGTEEPEGYSPWARLSDWTTTILTDLFLTVVFTFHSFLFWVIIIKELHSNEKKQVKPHDGYLKYLHNI